MVHLSARLAWHDCKWNGCVCNEPHKNASCIAVESIREEKDDELERKNSGKHVSELDGWAPPCSRDIFTYSAKGGELSHGDPLHRRYLSPVREEIPPYSILPAPYRWMSEEHFQDIIFETGIKIRGPNDPKKESGWIYEPDRQVKLLEKFWDTLIIGQSLVFFYVKQGNPFQENGTRLIVGIGRIKEISGACCTNLKIREFSINLVQ